MTALTVKPAELALEEGKPYSTQFGDIYATRSGAYGQACAVFLSEGEIATRWAGKQTFTILENGFGLGTNFLATLKSWREDPQKSERLEYVALECFPVTAYQVWEFCAPEVKDLASELSEKWPPCLPGFHVLGFDEGRVRLTLIFGDSRELSKKLLLSYDALFLDGFGPDKNPQMWEGALLRNLARYAKEGATVTTWCTKGDVRRALAQAGFELQKKQGFGKKRERLFGTMMAKRTKHTVRKIRDVIVIGAGLAGANVAYSLTKKGVSVRIVDAGIVPGAAASALSWAILHPHYSRDDNPLSKLSREGFLRTRSRLLEIENITGQTLFEQLGCLQMAHDDSIYEDWQRASQLQLPFVLPKDYAELLDKKEASERTGLTLARGGYFFPMAGMVRAGAFCRALVQASGVPYRGNTEVQKLIRSGDKWQLIGTFGEVVDEASDVVICAAMGSESLLGANTLGLEPLPGRITLLRDTDLNELKCPVSGEGYVAHMSDGYSAVGATYELERTGPWTERRAHEDNLDKLETLGLKAPEVVVTGGYYGVRASASGRMPILGKAYNEDRLKSAFYSKADMQKKSLWEEEGLWILTGLGSRGASFSVLCADILAALMTGNPVPADSGLLKTMEPARNLLRLFKAAKL